MRVGKVMGGTAEMQSRCGKLGISGGTEKETHNKKSNHHGPAHVSSTGLHFSRHPCNPSFSAHSQNAF